VLAREKILVIKERRYFAYLEGNESNNAMGVSCIVLSLGPNLAPMRVGSLSKLLILAEGFSTMMALCTSDCQIDRVFGKI
jgi:hypothetical protein